MRHALALVALVCAVLWLACNPAGLDLEEVARLHAEKRWEETIDPLRAHLAEEPDDRDASLLLGAALVQSRRYGEAMFHLRRAAAEGESANEAGLLLAATLLLIENFEAAIDAADQVLARDPSQTMGWIVRGQAALKSARHEIALESAERALELNADDFPARILQAGALLSLERREEAERAFGELSTLAPRIGPEAVATACTEQARFQATLLDDFESAHATLDSCSDVLITRAFWVEAGAQLYALTGAADAALALIRRALEANPGDHRVRILLADQLRQAGANDEAEEVLIAGTGQPQPLPLWQTLAMTRRVDGDLAGALDAIDGALGLGAVDTEALRFARADVLIDMERLDEAATEARLLKEPIYRDIATGRLLLERSEPEKALALFEGVLQQWPDHAGVRVLAARAAHEVGDEERALADLREATRAAPRETDASLLLARLYLLRGEPETAFAYARRHLDLRGPGEPEALLVAADAAHASGDLESARTALEALAQRPADRPLGVSELAAFVAETEGVAEARAVLSDAGLDLGAPENDVVLRRAVRLELDDGNPEAGLALLDELLASHPGLASAHAVRAHVLLEGGDATGAAAGFEAALAHDPESAESLAGLGTLAFQRGETEEAISFYERAVALAPGEPAYRYGLAQAHLAGGAYAEADEQLQTVLRSHPEHAGAANDLAWLLAMRGESLERALLLAERALLLSPSPEVRDTLGLVHLRAGRTDAAHAVFEEALAERPGYTTARYHLALVHLEQGEEAAAREALQTALAGEPFSEAAEARAALARLEE
jgi:tetratricopeptide (TPR) repeat protein